jgi:hypothetical protein
MQLCVHKGLTIAENHSSFRLEQARRNSQQGGLTGSIPSDECSHLARHGSQ